MLFNYLQNTFAVLAEIAPWFILGLFFAGLVRWLLPEHRIASLLGSGGAGTVVRATVLGAPLPLCSCGVLPAAIGLHRQGLSKSGTVSFLVATPQNGVDSLAVTYALLGPVFMVVRLTTSLISALSAGFAVLLIDKQQSNPPRDQTPTCCCSHEESNAPTVSLTVLTTPATPTAVNSALRTSKSEPQSVEGSSCCSSKSAQNASFIGSQRYAFGKLLGDLAPWLALGVAVAGGVNTLFSPGDIAQWGQGLLPMLAVIAISIPLYVCASASTPIAASLIAAGASPGLALAFLLVGPATNFAGVALIRSELGTRATGAYLASLTLTTLALASGVDALAPSIALNTSIVRDSGYHLIPPTLAMGATVMLLVLTLRIVVRDIIPSKASQPTERTSAPTHA